MGYLDISGKSQGSHHCPTEGSDLLVTRVGLKGFYRVPRLVRGGFHVCYAPPGWVASLALPYPRLCKWGG